MRFSIFVCNSFLLFFLLKMVAGINELSIVCVYSCNKYFLQHSLLFVNVSIQGCQGFILASAFEDLQPIGI